MTTITFEEDIKIDTKTTSVYDFIDVLKQNNFIPELNELKNITPEVMKDYKESLKSTSRISI